MRWYCGKGGVKEVTVLFGKYRMLHVLGSGRTGTVWLAVHLGLEEYRAIKRVSRRSVDYETFRREALILKDLRHPGIPMIYDLEEDSDFFYLIEEYLQGYSLYTLITSQGTLQETDAIRYGMQICGLVEYLHFSDEIPILYLDLQPNNLIICGGAVKLIDFDHAFGSLQANADRQRYGTRGCAAPEQYTSDRILDQRTDIYAIGAVLRFMVTGTLEQGPGVPDTISRPFGRIIMKCMDPDMERRYASAKEVESALQMLCVREVSANKDYKAIPSLILILAGMRPGAGTTHLAFGLCVYLAAQGYKALYEEHNPSQAVRTLALSAGVRSDRYGVYHIDRCYMKPWYGPAVRLEKPQGFHIIVKDCGTDWQEIGKELIESSGILITAGVWSPWETDHAKRLASSLEDIKKGRGDLKVILIFRHMTPIRLKLFGMASNMGGQLKESSVFVTPEYEDPFKQQGEEEAFFRTVWSAISGGGRSEYIKRGWFGRWKEAERVFLNAARALLTNAGLSESSEQDAEQE